MYGQRMRVLHLLASPVFSGPAENVMLLAEEQRTLGCEVSVAVDRKRPALASEEPAVPRLRQAQLLEEWDGHSLELSVKSGLWGGWSDLRRLRTHARRHVIDVVHAHFTHDHLLARWSLGASGPLLVRSVHAPRSIRWTLPFAHGYTVPSKRYLPLLEGRLAEVFRARIDPMFRPPDDRRALQTSLGLSGAPVVGMVSTFKTSRRHALGLAAFARLRVEMPSARLVLVGDGAREAAVRDQVRALGLGSNVTFAGYQSGQAFARWLQALDWVWVLGLGNDWSARAAAQARACGVRVVAVDEGALGEWADEVVEPSAGSIVEAMKRGSGPAFKPLVDASGDLGLLGFYRRVRDLRRSR